MPYCTNCGETYEYGQRLCRRCGFNLDSSPAGVQNAGQPSPAQNQTVRGIGNLRTSFLLYLIGGLTLFIPVVNFISAILLLVALLLLVLGWRALGRSNLQHAPEYKSTGKWFVYSFIIIFVAVTAITVAIVIYSISDIIASGVPAGNISVANAPFIQKLFGEFEAMIAVAGFGLLFVWNKVRTSMRALGDEISQPRLATAGWLFLIVQATGFASLLVSSIATFSGTNPYPATTSGGGLSLFLGSYSYLLRGDIVYFVLSLSNNGLQTLAAYWGYSGLKAAQSGGLPFAQGAHDTSQELVPQSPDTKNDRRLIYLFLPLISGAATFPVHLVLLDLGYADSLASGASVVVFFVILVALYWFNPWVKPITTPGPYKPRNR